MILSKQKEKSYEIDMCHGPLFGKIVLFAVPLILSGILQLLFNAADIVVAGRFAGSQALAAVGSTSSLINLLINVFIGLSIGANVMVARFFGAGLNRDVEETVHTAMFIALVGGVVMVFAGIFLARPMLLLMGTPEDVIGQSVVYMRIYFAGMPVMLVYNFGGAVLRAVGDTRRPLYFLLLAGIVNVVLNMFFVIVFHMGVAGVALATVLSQCISAGLIVRCLVQTDAPYRLKLKELRIVKDKLVMIAKIGVPAGLQGAVFSVSNVLIQSSVNSFGSIAMAGNTASSNIEGFIYNAMNAIYQTALSFCSQNYGAKEYKRMRKALMICLLLVTAVGLILGNAAVFCGGHLLRIYSTDSEVIRYGMLRLEIIATTYFLCGVMDTMVGGLRGMGCSVMPMLVSVAGACAFRIIWIFTVFSIDRKLDVLYWSYPASWLITAAAHIICYYLVSRKLFKRKA